MNHKDVGKFLTQSFSKFIHSPQKLWTLNYKSPFPFLIHTQCISFPCGRTDMAFTAIHKFMLFYGKLTEIHGSATFRGICFWWTQETSLWSYYGFRVLEWFSSVSPTSTDPEIISPCHHEGSHSFLMAPKGSGREGFSRGGQSALSS